MEQTVLGTEELGHKADKVLALLEQADGDLAHRSPQSRLAAIHIHSFGQYLLGLQGLTGPWKWVIKTQGYNTG